MPGFFLCVFCFSARSVRKFHYIVRIRYDVVAAYKSVGRFIIKIRFFARAFFKKCLMLVLLKMIQKQYKKAGLKTRLLMVGAEGFEPSEW